MMTEADLKHLATWANEIGDRENAGDARALKTLGVLLRNHEIASRPASESERLLRKAIQRSDRDLAEPEYLTIDEMLALFPPARANSCKSIMVREGSRIRRAAGSSVNHQAWPGGYLDHVREVMNIGFVLFDTLNRLRPLPFTLESVLVVMFLHDLEKIWKHEKSDTWKTKELRRAFRDEMIRDCGFELTLLEQNALRYVEGEGDDYSPKTRVMGKLAAICHMADIASARLWPDNPLEEGDPWLGMARVAMHELDGVMP